MVDEEFLERQLGALESVRSWSPRVISRFEGLLRSGNDEALFRINPIRFAHDRAINAAEAVDLFLHASVLGLFEMDWLLVCPLCSDVVDSFRSLRTMNNHFHCTVCQSDYEATLDGCIFVTFTVASKLRPIRFHRPKDLPAWEYAFVCRAAPEGLTADGVSWVEILKSITKALSWLPPAETTHLELTVEGEGLLYGWDIDSDAHFRLSVRGPAATGKQTVHIKYRSGVCEPSVGEIAPGQIAFEIANPTDSRGFVGIIQLPADAPERSVLHFAPSLSAKQLLTTQTFRDFFRSEVIRAVEGIAIKDITLLFTDLKASTALYDRIGDLNAYARVQRHFERLLDVSVRHRGVVIKTIGDAVMASFLTPADAVRAALDMRAEIDLLNDDPTHRDFVLKIGIHSGASIAVTLNEVLDYFGQTVNIAARIQNFAQGDEICISETVHAAPGVREILAGLTATRTVAELKGVNQALAVYRIAPSAQHAT